MEGPSPELRAGPLVYVDDLDDPVIAADDLHHVRRSLRLTAGDRLCLADGAGSWRTASLAVDGVGELGPVHAELTAPPALTVGLAIPKGPRLEVAVTKLTELGVDEVLLLAAERSVVRWPQREVGRRLDRLRRVVREAGMQSRRARLPRVDGVFSVAEVVAARGGEVALAEPGGTPPDLTRPVVLVGPEGGWTPAELASCTSRVGLGQTVLRVETAAMAVGVALAGQRGGWLR